MESKRIRIFITSILLIFLATSFISADAIYYLEYDFGGESMNQSPDIIDMNYGVITKSFELKLYNPAAENLEVDYGDTLNFITRINQLDTYNWTISSTKGTRTFDFGGESFTIEVKSELEELFDHIDYVTVWINQDSSKIIVNDLDIDGTTNEYFNFNEDEFSGWSSWQNIFDGVNLNITFEENDNYPTYHSLSLSGTTRTILNQIIGYNSGNLSFDNVTNIEANYSLLNELIDIYGLTGDYSASVNFDKTSTIYQVNINKGYGNFNESTMNTIREIIADGVNLVNPSNVSKYVSPYFDISDYLNYVTWTTEVDMSSILIVDGTYTIPLTLTDQYNNEMVYLISLVLDIENNEEQIVENNTYVPVNEEIAEYIQEITGLPEGAELTVAVFGENIPETFTSTVEEIPEDVEDSINYIELTLNQSSTGGNFKVNFSVPDTFDKDRIQAYVYENSSWTSLPTTFIETTGGKHYFYFTVTHFSEFLIAENTEESVVNNLPSGRSTCKSNYECTGWSACIDGNKLRVCTLIDQSCNPKTDRPDESKACSTRGNEQGEVPDIIDAGGEVPGQGNKKGLFSRLTGAAIGTFGPAGSLFVLFLLLGGIIIILILIKIRRQTLKERREENRNKEEKKMKRYETQKSKKKISKKKQKVKSVKTKSKKPSRSKGKTVKKKLKKKKPNALKGTKKKPVKKKAKSKKNN